jgi:hypothetical protein
MTSSSVKIRPPQVQKAWALGDRAALSKMGKRGAEVAAENRAYAAFKRVEWKAQILADAVDHAEANRAGWDDDYTP